MHKSVNANGNLTTKIVTTHGRTFSLQKILDRTLLDQEEANMLRPPFPADGSLQQILKDLNANGRIVL